MGSRADNSTARSWKGRWVNPEGYELRPAGLEEGRRLWHFSLLNPPLQWHCDDGLVLEPCRNADLQAYYRREEEDKETTEGGSVPWFGVWYVDRWASPRGFPFHDIVYRRGYVWAVRLDGSSVRLHLSRGSCDALLREHMLADGNTRARAAVVYYMVRLFGWAPWRYYRAKDRTTESVP